MPSWFNPRVAVVALSIAVLVPISQVGEPVATIRRDCLVCTAMLLLYGLAFLVPVWQTLGFRYALWPAVTLCAAWMAVALALVSDALPRTLAERMEHHVNWAMGACCIAGSAAFLLFFQGAVRSLRLREDVLEARHSRD